MKLEPISKYKYNIDNTILKDRVYKSISRHTMTPIDRYEYPQTSSQDIGWYHKPLVYYYINIDEL